jgi:hypothetical protein
MRSWEDLWNCVVGRVKAGFIWFRTGTSGGLLWIGNEHSVHEKRGISRPAERLLLVSEEGRSSMKLVRSGCRHTASVVACVNTPRGVMRHTGYSFNIHQVTWVWVRTVQVSSKNIWSFVLLVVFHSVTYDYNGRKFRRKWSLFCFILHLSLTSILR